MSTVLWANRLIDGVVTSDQSDKYAMHKHLSKIDEIAGGAGLMALSEICDTTDLRFNIEDLSLPEGMASTNEWMAAQGVWVDAEIAASQLAALLTKAPPEVDSAGGRLDQLNRANAGFRPVAVEYWDALQPDGRTALFTQTTPPPEFVQNWPAEPAWSGVQARDLR